MHVKESQLHGGPKFGPLSPPSRDSICMPSQVWSIDFLFEIFDHVINSRRIRRFGPYSNSSNTQVWSSSNREKGPNLRIRIVCDHFASNQFEFTILVHLNSSNWTKPAYSKSLNMDQSLVTKPAYSKKINHVIKNFEEKVNGPNLYRHAYAVT